MFVRAAHNLLEFILYVLYKPVYIIGQTVLKSILRPGLKTTTLHTNSVYSRLYFHSPSNFSALITAETGICVRVCIMCIYASNAKTLVFLLCQWMTEQTSGWLSSYTWEQSRKLLLILVIIVSWLSVSLWASFNTIPSVHLFFLEASHR